MNVFTRPVREFQDDDGREIIRQHRADIGEWQGQKVGQYAGTGPAVAEKGNGFPGIIPNVDKVLQFLHAHGIQCWVVTGSGQHNLIDALNDIFNHAFTGIISSFDVKNGKPDPEPYLKAWERSGFKKEECMVVENAPLGVRAAKAAGLFCCAVNTGILPDDDLIAEHADLIMPDMATLLERLKSHIIE